MNFFNYFICFTSNTIDGHHPNFWSLLSRGNAQQEQIASTKADSAAFGLNSTQQPNMFAGSNSSAFPQQNEPIVFSTLASTLNPDPSFIASTSALNALSAHNMLHSFNLGASNKITTSQIPTNQQTYFDPMLYNLALQQPQCSTNPFDLEKFNLLRAFLQNQQSTSQTTHSIATTNSQQ